MDSDKIKEYLQNNYEHILLTIAIIVCAYFTYVVIVGPEQEDMSYLYTTASKKVFIPKVLDVDPNKELKSALVHNDKSFYDIMNGRDLFVDLVLKQQKLKEKYKGQLQILGISDTNANGIINESQIDNRPFITGWIPIGKVEESNKTTVLLLNSEEHISLSVKKGDLIGNLFISDITPDKIVLSAKGFKDTSIDISQINIKQ